MRLNWMGLKARSMASRHMVLALGNRLKIPRASLTAKGTLCRVNHASQDDKALHIH
jgi:hypothetical protein